MIVEVNYYDVEQTDNIHLDRIIMVLKNICNSHELLILKY